VTGVMLAAAPADYQYHDSYFVVAHFHYVIVGGLILGLFSGLYYWYPRMFGLMLNEALGKWNFWTFFIGFHLTFFPQHFLGLMGMPRRYFTYPEEFQLGSLNLISTAGAILMTIGTIIFIINIFVTHSKGEKVSGDPWDGRTLEWAIPNPTPHYNFLQTPLVRGLDALWIEKMAGNKKMTPAEPVGDIHMPNNSILPFVMSLGFFIAGFGFIYFNTAGTPALIAVIAGLGIGLGCMFLRSWIDDHGHHLHKEDLLKEDKGVDV
jgi:cytochrome c oxidase subunit 1